MKSIACIGEVMIEMVADGPDRAALGVAGDTYNTAVYLARALKGADQSVNYVTALGGDAFSARIETAIAGHGIGTDYIERRGDKMPGLYAIETDAAGERSFAYWRGESAARTLFSKPCAVGLDRLGDFDLIYLSGITLAILQRAVRDDLMAALWSCQSKGALIAYDSNHRPRLWEDQKTAQRVNAAMWRLCDIGLPSLDDEMALFGDASEGEVLARFADYGVMRGALKRGVDGPLGFGGDQAVVRYQSVDKVVDSTAAGDSFNAGYLSGVARGSDESACLKNGHDLASKVIQHRGAIISENS